MKKIITLILITFFTISCSSKKNHDGNMVVKGQIKGLKKGKIYLQKIKDTVLVSVDSITLLGDDSFVLADQIQSPEMYFLTFNGNTSDKRIMFFGEEGTISINDELEHFGINPSIKGSKNQEIFEKYSKTNKRFKNARLDFIKKDFDARKTKDTALVKKIANDAKRMVRKRYLYTANFAVANADSEVAPYIALTELYDANIKLLDTINNSLSEKIKKSKYGKKLAKFITDIKKKESK